jgi:hypothetical protein
MNLNRRPNLGGAPHSPTSRTEGCTMRWVHSCALLVMYYVSPRLTLKAGRNGGRKAGLSIYRGSARASAR